MKIYKNYKRLTTTYEVRGVYYGFLGLDSPEKIAYTAASMLQEAVKYTPMPYPDPESLGELVLEV